MKKSEERSHEEIFPKLESVIEAYPEVQRQLKKLRKNIYTSLEKIKVEGARSKEPVTMEEIKNLRFKTIHSMEPYGPAFTCAWFKMKFSIEKYLNIPREDLFLNIDIGGEGIVYCNGRMIKGITSKLCYIDNLQSKKGKTLINLVDLGTSHEYEILVDGSYNGSSVAPPYGIGVFKGVTLLRQNKEVFDIYYDLLNLAYLYHCATGQQREELYKVLMGSLEEALTLDSEKILRVKENIKNHLKGKEIKKDFTFTAIGHSHLDLGWLWPIRETKRKAVRTFLNQIYNMEKYPFYVYGASQPQQFQWLKENHSELFEKVKEFHGKGQLELQGGMWTECDTNLPSGESLIRQIYYGKKFFKDNFNEEVEMCWLPDVFGYSGNLPQILLKSGLKYFMTIKLSWNKYNMFPHHTFNWVGIDGSSVLAHMAPNGSYVSGGTPSCLDVGYKAFLDKEVSDKALFIYGAGDGGGGAGEGHLELLKRVNENNVPYKVEFKKAEEFFQDLEVHKAKFASHKGELYFENHQGTYTTQGKNKLYNRLLENILHEVEYLNAYVYVKGGETYNLDDIWKEILLYQFHDIIPGSSINRIYKESVERYQVLEMELKEIKEKLLQQLPNDSQGKMVLNTSPFPRSGYYTVGKELYEYEALPYSTTYLKKVKAIEGNQLKYTEHSIANGLLKVTFKENGEIASLIDKDNFEYSGGYLNRLTLYKDPFTSFDAWDIDESYLTKRNKTLKAYNHEEIIEPTRVIRRNYYRNHRTKIVQDVILETGSPYVKFKTRVDYHETLKMLRANFLPTIYSDLVECDIQMGSIKRSTKNETSIEKAQYEICAHKYVNLEKDNRGIALINDCKYGHRVKEGTISLNLLRSPVYPDLKADRGQHEFSYAIYPYKEKEKQLQQVAYNFQRTVALVEKTILPLVTINNEKLILETIKKAYDNEGIVVRIYNSCDQEEAGRIKGNFNYEEVYESNLVEAEEVKTDIEDAVVFKAFEIKTFIFRGIRK